LYVSAYSLLRVGKACICQTGYSRFIYRDYLKMLRELGCADPDTQDHALLHWKNSCGDEKAICAQW
jgi:hypothetical protein